ncbi:GxGYxYP domain-containing protein [Acidisarcina polymorpha]|uniref:GxGYxYP domain-containing protein n=1 Tax=Acidisarcina polymorpha TaxID=2211140 RepID=UPI000DEEF487|nr:GxGYxYP domain-containing protein [Acidisarcina polymorpha]
MSISRRTFLTLSGAATGASALRVPALAQPDDYTSDHGLYWPPNQALPIFPEAVHLDAADLTALDGDQQGLLVSLQGIVNRRRPRLYFYWGTDPTNLEWLKTIRVSSTISKDPWSLFERYRDEVKGAIVFDPNVPDTINLATTLAGMCRAVIATAELAAAHNLPVIEDLRSRFADKFAVYNYALSEVWPK